MVRLPALVLLACMLAAGLPAQEADPASRPPQAAGTPRPKTALELKTLALDIAVSVYRELKDLAASEGIDTQGSAADLRSRLYSHFGLEAPDGPKPDSGLTIERASGIEYLKTDGAAQADRILKFEGPAALEIRTDDGFSHRLQADLIVYDRENGTVDASGNVTYTRASDSRSDTFSGSRIVVDLDSYSGVFVDGSFDLEPMGTGSRTLLFRFGTLSTRGEAQRLEDATVTACEFDPPHYRVEAGTAWILGNGDWALTNATLYLGAIPVLWLPFFYYPGQELAFHPVVGFRNREGVFLQTTTYLIGSRKADTGSASLLSTFQNQSGGDGTISGMFIRRTSGQDSGSANGSGEKGNMLVLYLDLYSSLGVHAGLSGSFAGTGSDTADFSLGIGASRSIFLESNGFYSPLDYAGEYVSVWNRSELLGLDLPLRYATNFSYSLKSRFPGAVYGIVLKAPFQSDPFFQQDFGQRAESSTFFSMFDANQEPVGTRGSLTQSLVANLSWSAPASKSARLLSKVTISRLASQIGWKTRAYDSSGFDARGKRLLAVDPSREFYYPDNFGIIDLGVSASGDIFRFVPASESGSPSVSPISRANLGWNLTGQFNLDEKFDSADWSTPADVDGSVLYLLYRAKSSLAGNFELGALSDSLVFTLKSSFSAQDQARPYLVDTRSSPSTPHPYLLSDYAYRSASWDAGGTVSLYPLKSVSALAASSVVYSLSTNLYKLRYAGLDGSGVDASPLYDATWLEWGSQSISVNQVAATISHSIARGATQQLGVSGSLPPLKENYSGFYKLAVPFFEAQVQGNMGRETAADQLEPKALSGRIRLGGNPFPAVTSDLSWDFSLDSPGTSVSAISYKGARASFTARRSPSYSFVSSSWISAGDERFRPYEAGISYSTTLDSDAQSQAGENTPAGENTTDGTATGKEEGGALRWNLDGVRISVKPAIAYTQNLIRFTESNLTASLGFELKSDKGTSFGFSGSTANKSPWRYWPDIFPLDSGLNPRDYRRNLLNDLADSVSIWDAERLRNSQFKLQNLKISLAQDLHDWNVSADLGVSPYKVTPSGGRAYYKLDFAFSFTVSWKDIPEIKTSASYARGVFTE